jgi:hypothetical protein
MKMEQLKSPEIFLLHKSNKNIGKNTQNQVLQRLPYSNKTS